MSEESFLSFKVTSIIASNNRNGFDNSARHNVYKIDVHKFLATCRAYRSNELSLKNPMPFPDCQIAIDMVQLRSTPLLFHPIHHQQTTTTMLRRALPTDEQREHRDHLLDGAKIHKQRGPFNVIWIVRLTAQAAIFVAAITALTEFMQPGDLITNQVPVITLRSIEPPFAPSQATEPQAQYDQESSETPPIPIHNLGFMTNNPSWKDMVVEQVDDISKNAQYKVFFDKYCSAGSGTVSHWPQGEDAWQRRAPSFLIIGAKKAGTTSYWGKLSQHPFIFPGKKKEMHSFQSKGLGQWRFPSQIGTKLNVEEARRTLYDANASLYPQEILMKHPQLVSFEATPDYLLLSDISTQIILCTTPWVKILVTLRDPLERLFSNYNFILENMPTLNATFEEWVEQDLETLRQAGVITDGKFAAKPKASGRGEQVWWKHYQKMSAFRTPERQVGRSLYVLQLEAWLKWMREAGRDPSSNLRVVWQEDLRTNTNRTLNDIASWLGLPHHKFNTDAKLDMMVTNYSTEMAPATRSRLEQFFAPYNTRLHNLLQRESITFPAP